MMYNPETGHRIKDPNVPGRITWVHSMMKQAGMLSADWELTQCLFGEHLLSKYPDKPVALVESEKTSIICAGLMPRYLWLATAGHLRALRAWRSLPHEQQLRWEPYARDVEPHRPPFDHLARISGNNLFISAYHGFATLGNEHVPSPAPYDKSPPFLVKILGAYAAGDTLYINWKLDMDDSEGRYRLPTKVQLASPGRGLSTGDLRNFLAEGTANDAAVTTCIPGYISIWGLDLQSYQIHARCILLDTKTGYRSQYLPVSGIVSL